MRIPEANLPLTIEEYRRHYIRTEPTEGWMQIAINADIRWQHPDAGDVMEQMMEVAQREGREVYNRTIDVDLANRRFPV